MNTICQINYKQIGLLSLLFVIIVSFFSCANDDENDDINVASVFRMTGSEILGERSVRIKFNKVLKPSEQLMQLSNYTITVSETGEAISLEEIELEEDAIIFIFSNNLTEGLYEMELEQLEAEDNTKLRDNNFNFYYKKYPEEAIIEVIGDAIFKISFPKRINQQESYRMDKFSVRRNGERLNVETIYGSDNIIFLRLESLGYGDGPGRIVDGSYRVIAFEMTYDDGEQTTEIFEIEHHTRIAWKKLTNVMVQTTTNPADPTTWTFYNMKNNTTYHLDDLGEIYERNWDMAFALDGYTMMVYYKVTLGTENLIENELISANTRRSSDDHMDIVTRGTDWCEKDSPNIYELNASEDTSVPFVIFDKKPGSIHMHVPNEYTDIDNNQTPMTDGYLVISDIYGGNQPETIPYNYVYNLTMYYMFPVNEFERLQPYPIDVD